ncbi:helix-turn-helix transcriptional regulator [Mycobacterium montefiorense]|uniref:helix-turn-helix transcriptional regulator n=1 Tax=Mycobacterium montefiorense TaxID=154654 RepID=UPI0021DEB01C|nr:AraC family transcriptional regulator [Mycobacterium montefiorense]MCV7427620.1 AraC family transcriptional regulator [Mycobacterium montefiorense]GLE50621.1 AraC family transcriptional regulator [Mycobacterium montefiorense]
MTDDASVPAAHGWITARSLEDAVTLCGAAFYPQQDIGVLDDPRAFSLTQRVGTLGPITVGEVTFGSPVWMDCGEDRSAYHVNVPLSGRLESTHRGQHMSVRHGVAAVYHPEGHTAISRWEGGGRTLFVKLDRGWVNDALAHSLGRELTSQIDFHAAMPTTSGPGRSWIEMLLLLKRQLFAPDSLIHRPLVGLPMIDSLVWGLLFAAGHREREAVMRGSGHLAPSAVLAAIDIIEAESEMPLTVSALAVRTSVSVRTLYDGFRRHLGTTPMAYLRDVRLRRAHETLLESDPSVSTVAAVAHRWGFTHHGRFAAAYANRYGEKPGTTLRRTTFGAARLRTIRP